MGGCGPDEAEARHGEVGEQAANRERYGLESEQKRRAARANAKEIRQHAVRAVEHDARQNDP